MTNREKDYNQNKSLISYSKNYIFYQKNYDYNINNYFSNLNKTILNNPLIKKSWKLSWKNFYNDMFTINTYDKLKEYINSDRYLSYSYEIQIWFYQITQAWYGLYFEDNFIKKNNLSINKIWDTHYKIDAYKLENDVYSLYQIKSYEMCYGMLYGEYEATLKWIKDENITKDIIFYKVFCDGKVKLFEIKN